MIDTFSKFFYQFDVTKDSQYLAFDEGDGELTAEIRQGKYAPSQGLTETAGSMSDVGTQGYSISLNRTNRHATISAPAPFDLLIQSGSSGASSIFSLLGFTGADRTGLNTYTGNLPVGKEYRPQYMLQDYVSRDHYKKSIDPTVKKTADGRVEVVTFGTEQLMQCALKYATNKKSDGRVILNNPTGVEDLVSFMDWAIKKAPVEFMPDVAEPEIFDLMILEKTPESGTGTDYKLVELYNKQLPGFFETGTLLFRLTQG